MKVIDIRNYGAVGDGKYVNTYEIQSAINACGEGDIVLIADGDYVSGAIYLKSNIILRIEKGARLIGSCDLKDYPIMKYRFEGLETDCYASLINTVDVPSLTHIIIEGGGVIDASGRELYRQEIKEKCIKRGRAVCIRNTDSVIIRDVRIQQSPAWCLHLIYCNNITIVNVRIQTKYDEHGNAYDWRNGDGIDIDSCIDVLISDSQIESEDDCIAIKSGKDEEGRKIARPTENVKVHDCTFKSGFGVAIGSEMSGDVRDVTVRDCTFIDTFSVGSVKAPRGRGGVIERITFQNCTHTNLSMEFQDCKWFRGAIYIDQFYSCDNYEIDKKKPVDEGTATIRDITFENIRTKTVAGNAIFIAGLPENNLQNITLKHIYAKGKYGLKAYNVNGLHMDDVTVDAEYGEEMEMLNVTGMKEI